MAKLADIQYGSEQRWRQSLPTQQPILHKSVNYKNEMFRSKKVHAVAEVSSIMQKQGKKGKQYLLHWIMQRNIEVTSANRSTQAIWFTWRYSESFLATNILLIFRFS